MVQFYTWVYWFFISLVFYFFLILIFCFIWCPDHTQLWEFSKEWENATFFAFKCFSISQMFQSTLSCSISIKWTHPFYLFIWSRSLNVTISSLQSQPRSHQGWIFWTNLTSHPTECVRDLDWRKQDDSACPNPWYELKIQNFNHFMKAKKSIIIDIIHQCLFDFASKIDHR